MESQVFEYEGTWEEIAAHEPEFRGFRLRVSVLRDNGMNTSDDAPTAAELLKLPAQERNRIIASQAATLESEYRNNLELTAFETFGPDEHLYFAVTTPPVARLVSEAPVA